jgi:hypothetical protein
VGRTRKEPSPVQIDRRVMARSVRCQRHVPLSRSGRQRQMRQVNSSKRVQRLDAEFLVAWEAARVGQDDGGIFENRTWVAEIGRTDRITIDRAPTPIEHAQRDLNAFITGSAGPVPLRGPACVPGSPGRVLMGHPSQGTLTRKWSSSSEQ